MIGSASKRTAMGMNYRIARENCGFSLSDAAKVLGVSAKTLAGYEEGKTSPKADRLLAMCKLYRCSADRLLSIA